MRLRKKAIGFIFFLLVILIIIISSNVYIGNTQIISIETSITYPNSDTLVNQEYITKYINKKFPDLIGQKRKDVEIDELEAYLRKEPYLEKIDAYITYKGKIKVDIHQVEPILRVYSKNSKEYYIDKTGSIIPLKENSVADVMIANGNILIDKDILNKKRLDSLDMGMKVKNEKTLSQLYYLASKLYYDSILSFQIDQIYIQNQGVFELYPKVGDYVIDLGGIEDIDNKLTKLKYLYKEAFTRIGWDNYSIINLNYKDQVICTKKN